VEILKYIIEDLRQDEVLKELPVIRMEIDYELATLYDALQSDNKVEIIKTKERLEQLRQQWLHIDNQT